ncbi:MAG: restriction endonuclease [Ramlibacter sp.]|jgi:restriction system protein
MGRRKNTTADDIVFVISKLPWWTGVLLAALVWVLFTLFTPAVPSAADAKPAQMATHAVITLMVKAAPFIKYFLCFLFLMGALVSFIGNRKRKALLAEAQAPNGAAAVQGMSWREFEMLVGQAFRQQGYTVEETGAAGPDGGVDLVLRKGSERFLVQCKQWRALKVGVTTVRELYGVMAAQGAAGGFVVTSGRFTQEAVAFGAGRNIELIDGVRLQRMMQHVESPSALAGPPTEAKPACPKCQSEMVLRTAQKGANAGKTFWGCSTYPQCNGTRPAN